MAEVPAAGEHHRRAGGIDRLDNLRVADRSAGLDDGRDASVERHLRAVGEREKGVGCEHRTLQIRPRLLDREANRVHTTHLPGADPNRRQITRQDDRVGADVLADPPGEQQFAPFRLGGPALGDDLHLGTVLEVGVAVLHEHAADDLAQSRLDHVAPSQTEGRLQRVALATSPTQDTLAAAAAEVPVFISRQDWEAYLRCFDIESASDTDTARPFLQRPLARVGIEPQRHRRQAEGDSLDLSALLDYETDRRHGDNPDPFIYESSRLTKRDLSVLVLLDCSGSTAEDSGGRVVFEEERRLAGDLTVAMERLGDRVGTYGFYSRGKDAVRFLRVKNFNARFDTAAKRRLQSVQPSGFTRMGAAIRHATHVLESQALAKNMVLLVIGDGLPYDDGYEDRYARADARQAIQEAVLRGIGVAGIGIRSSTEPDVLEDVWSDASFRVIGQCDDIQRHLRGLLLNALSVTRSNGRRRELLSEEHHGYLRSLHAARRSAMNTYA